MEIEYNILGINKRGETKFLSNLHSEWVDEVDREKCPSFSKDHLDNIMPVLKEENDSFIFIGSFPTFIKWEGRNGKKY